MTTRPRLWQVFLWMAVGTCILTLADFSMKLLALRGVHPATGFLFATPLALLVVALLAMRTGGIHQHLGKAAPKAVLIRGVLLLLMSYLNFTGMMFNPYSQQVMLLQLSPILAGLLAIVLLKEGLGKHQFVVMLLCLVGAWLVIDPRFGSGSWYLLLPVAAAACNGLVHVFVAANRDQATALGYTFYGMLLVAIVSGLIHFAWQLPTPDLLAFVYCQMVGGFGVIGLATVTHAMQLAGAQGQAGKVALMYYVQMPVALLLGYLVLSEVSNNIALLGACLILLAGLSLPLRSGVQAVRVSKRNS